MNKPSSALRVLTIFSASKCFSLKRFHIRDMTCVVFAGTDMVDWQIQQQDDGSSRGSVTPSTGNLSWKTFKISTTYRAQAQDELKEFQSCDS